MTPVAVGVCVDDVAAQSNQSSIPSFEVEGTGAMLKPISTFHLILFAFIFRPRANARSLERHQQNGDCEECRRSCPKV